MPIRPRPGIESLNICPHGGLDYAELERIGVRPEDMLDFSVSGNPFGPPPAIRGSLMSVVIDRYPDSNSTELRSALARILDVDAESIIVGNGSMELIRLVASAYFGSADTILIIEPTFGEYEVACRIAGSKILRVRAQAERSFKFDIAETVDLICRHHPKGIFLCNPNNPTGQYLNRHEIEEILSASQDSLLILDEAYVAFAENAWHSLDLIKGEDIVILRSMTKDYALAGLRLGYAVAHPEIIKTLRRVCPPWNVNAVAQYAGLLALGDSAYLQRCQEGVRQAKGFLKSELTQLGLPPLPSQAHLFLVKVGDGKQFRQDLLKYGIIVRDCASFGLPEYVRIAPRTMPECQRLVLAIKEILKL
ncbi:MAG: pyridoxal phosphate-dependent aminotransferase [Dehalococcoidia bacterium]|nr:Threonine-phosphate decarboxylase [Chloroflexota bacterium]MBT9159421.1 Threonine-phosphate decarboxylase [Chloroflexota bacterium]MBT9162553.1 Threonine-phosphate decarboxylase [Chloroflexota bacterium]